MCSELPADTGLNISGSELQKLQETDLRKVSGLVERFNQTLKVMLCKTAVQEGKDWDLLIPYVLFAYREVPQSSTGFSPFELLYGREVKGPLDIVKETWEASERSNQSVVSYVVSIREKLGKMAGLVRENWRKLNRHRRPGTTTMLVRGASRRETVSWFCYILPTTHYWLDGKGHIKW